MAYLNNNTVTVEAILTRKGREILARGQGLNITKFAVADDEIDYSLWSPTHPLGTAYYGAIIENMPLVEAVPDETQAMRYRLFTMERGSNIVPIVSMPGGTTSIELRYLTDSEYILTPQTTGNLNGSLGYTVTLYDSSAADIEARTLAPEQSKDSQNIITTTGITNSKTVSGMTFRLTPKDVTSVVTTKIIIVGNETGGSETVDLTVNPKTSS